MTTAWFLHYRPQRIDELDCIQARTSLGRIVTSGRIPKALLFTGPRGTGKTSAARIIAKVLNCEKSPDKIEEPCNQCDQCKSITAGTSLDVLEIDGASNRGIDDIRDLREKVKLAPSSARNRIYIIDEVHMLTTEAFNALLKTLEEPPVHAYFILCTTDPQKVPETIISRCTRIIFKHATDQETLGKLQRIVKEEKLSAQDGTLELITKAAKGSFRDAVKLLEQAASGRKVSLTEVKELLGQLESADPLKLLAFLSAKDSYKSIEEIGKVISSGANLKNYIEDMVTILRSLLLEKLGIGEGEDNRWRYQHVQSLAEMNLSDVNRLIRLLSRAYTELRDAVLPQLPLELAAVEWCSADGETKEDSRPSLHSAPSSNPTAQDKEKSSAAVITAEEIIANVVPAAPETGGVKKINGEAHAAPKVETVVSFSAVTDHWNDVLLKVRPKNHSVEALLRACRPLSIQDSFLDIEVFYKFHKDRLETEKYRQLVEECLAEITGLPLRIRYRLGQRPMVAKVPDTVRPQNDDVSGKEVEEEIIKAATEIFKGTLVE